MEIVLPAPVQSVIGVRKVYLRRFATPYHVAYCGNCSWESYDYPTEAEAEDRGESHAFRCSARLNEIRALQVEVTPVEAQNLERGQHILTKHLTALFVENCDQFDDEIMVTYSLNGQEPQILMLPVGHVVKVVA